MIYNIFQTEDRTSKIQGMDELKIGNNDMLTRTCIDVVDILKEQATTLQRLEGHMKKDTNSEIRNDEWNMLAKVLDRIFLIVYSLFSLLVFLVFFIKMAE